MIPAIFINCSRFPFIDWIMKRQKIYETRNRNTLRQLVGQRVYLVETGKNWNVIRCSAVIRCAKKVKHRGTWNLLRDSHCVPEESVYDWNSDTKCKWLYLLEDVHPVPIPFTPPEGTRHGLVWMEVKFADLQKMFNEEVNP